MNDGGRRNPWAALRLPTAIVGQPFRLNMSGAARPLPALMRRPRGAALRSGTADTAVAPSDVRSGWFQQPHDVAELREDEPLHREVNGSRRTG